MEIILPLSKNDEAFITEIARKMVNSEEAIAIAWAESYKKNLLKPKENNGSEADFQDKVKLFLTSVADGNFSKYFERIEKKGIELALAKASYEYLILSFHLFEDATAPHLQKLFPENLGSVVSVLDHLYHNVIAILARAYFAELEREKEKIINIVAHDLKTPLTAIMLMAQTLGRGNISPERAAKAAEKIWSAGKDMSELIESMLDYGKLKAGKSELDLEETDIVSVVKNAAAISLDNAKAKQLDLTINGMASNEWDDLPCILTKGDRKLVGRAWNNYLSNAIKHARTKVDVRVLDEQNDVVISVQDDGAGIPKEYLDTVFDDYFVIPGAKAGTGLGLPSVKMITQLHRGKCGVESEIGVGSRFYFCLPKS